MMNKVLATINGVATDVTTVMDTTVSYEPTESQIEGVRAEVRKHINEYFDCLDEASGLDTMFGTDGVFWEQKGWLIKAMENHPLYNGNLQIVIKDTPMVRHIDKQKIKDFFVWAINRLRENPYYINPKTGEIINEIEMLGVRENLRKQVHYADRLADNTFDIHKEQYYDKFYNRKIKLRQMAASVTQAHYTYEKEIQMLECIYDYTTCSPTDPQMANEALAETLNKTVGEERFCSAGQKISRIVGKIAKRCKLNTVTDIRNNGFFDQDGNFVDRVKDFGWNYQYAIFSDAINPIFLKATAVISVHPVDFLRMSFGTNWASCMTTDKNNIRGMSNNYHGMYCGGTESYMLDKHTVVFYFLPAEYDGSNPEWEDKVKRCLFFIGEDKLIQSRVYPDGRDGGEDRESLPKDIRTVMQKLISEMFDVPNYWSNAGGTSACAEVITTGGVQYKDYLCYEDCNVSFLKRIDGYKNKRILPIGRQPICPECGCDHSNEENIFCEDCAGVLVCERCGARIYDTDEGYCIDGDWYCNNCVDICEECGCATINAVETNRGWVCEECRDRHYHYSEYDDIYVHENDAVWTQEGNVYCENSEGYEYCEECEEYHDTEEMNWDSETERYYCEDCYARLLEERAEEEAEYEEVV